MRRRCLAPGPCPRTARPRPRGFPGRRERLDRVSAHAVGSDSGDAPAGPERQGRRQPRLGLGPDLRLRGHAPRTDARQRLDPRLRLLGLPREERPGRHLRGASQIRDPLRPHRRLAHIGAGDRGPSEPADLDAPDLARPRVGDSRREYMLLLPLSAPRFSGRGMGENRGRSSSRRGAQPDERGQHAALVRVPGGLWPGHPQHLVAMRPGGPGHRPVPRGGGPGRRLLAGYDGATRSTPSWRW